MKYLDLSTADDADMSQAEVVRGIELGEYAPVDVTRWAEVVLESRDLKTERDTLETARDALKSERTKLREDVANLAAGLYDLVASFKQYTPARFRDLVKGQADELIAVLNEEN